MPDCKCNIAGDGGNKSARIAQNEADIAFLLGTGAFTEKENPAVDAITVPDVDNFRGCAFVLTAAGNSQTLPSPTDTTVWFYFTAINRSASTDNITVNNVVLEPGESARFIWDQVSWAREDDSGIFIDDGVTITPQGSPRTIKAQGILHDPLGANPAHQEGLRFYNSVTRSFTSYIDIADVALNDGEELWTRVYNNTGAQIDNGSVVRIDTTVVSGWPTIQLAKADSPDTTRGIIGIATHDIGIAEEGIVTRFGMVRDLDTSTFVAGDTIYVSATNAGEFTKTQPVYPNYIITLGSIDVVDAANGSLSVNISGRVEDILENGWNGAFLETVSFLVSSDGATITGSLERDGGGDLTMNFSTGFQILDTTPAATIVLTAGTSTVPVKNFIYVPISTKVLTLSTTDWPAEEHIKVANLILRDAATTQTDGALGNRNWNDHVAGSNQIGHILHVNERIRVMNAQWDSGVAPTLTINAAASPDNVWVSVTSGFVYQMHKQTFAALNMQTGSDIHIVNDSVSPYKTLTDLNSQLTDASGGSMSGRYYNLVIWGVQNRTGTMSHLMCNLPTASYALADPATRDDDKTSVFTIPTAFRGIAFLIARFTLRHQVTAGGTWTLIATEDLRGSTPQTAGGATSPIVTEFQDGVFRIQDTADITKEIAFEASGITTATTRTLTVQDLNGTIALAESTVLSKADAQTLAIADSYKRLEFANGVNDWGFTFPQNSDVAIPVNAKGVINKTGSGGLQLTKGTGATFRSKFGDVNLELAGADGYFAFWEKTATNTFLITGSIIAA